ncbi:MAG: outer membrane protein transport protein [Myxococcota bacterium]
MTSLLSLALSPAHAASLDLIQVGGAWGTPAATNPTALWWNPAGLAVGAGKIQFIVEGAPTFATVTAARANPNYGQLDPTFGDAGYPTTYDYSGTDTIKFNGVVPFVGVSTGIIPGLGVGIGLAVPTARGGTSDQEWGANRFALRDAGIQAIDVMGGVSYDILNKVSLGGAFHFVDSSYFANLDTSIFPDLAHSAEAQLGGADLPVFQDGMQEDQAYSSTLVMGGEEGNAEHGALKDTAMTFGAGIYVHPIGKKLGISLAYTQGVRLDHEGDLTMKFQCAPDYVLAGAVRLGMEQQGLCNSTIQGKGKVGYDLPSRVNFGVVVSPIDRLRAEVMGSYVMWSAFDDYEIHTEIAAEAVDAASPELAAATADLLSQDRLWARDNQDTYWLGVDVKGQIHPKFLAGARVMYDHHAIPDQAVSANNIDNDEVIVGLLAEVNPIEQLGIGLSFNHHFLMERDITNSAYGITVDEDNPKEDRWFYPEANGKYGGSINRLGIVVRGHVGGQGW